MTNYHEILDFLLAEKKLADPFGLPDMERTCERLTQAILKKEQITVCGDYDVDGTLATTILLRFLRKAGAKVNQYIPHRTNDGYGIKDETMKFLKKEYNTKVAISVDTGTVAFDAAEEALKQDIDLIVTDHHNLSDKGLPPVFALVNAKRLEDENNVYLTLCGAAIAFYLTRGLNTYWQSNKYSLNIPEDDYLVLAMMGTVADVMPLLRDNRIIVKYGLQQLPHCKIEGLIALFNELGIHQPTAKDIAWRFAPIINAAGRLGSAQQALDLLSEENKMQAIVKAKDLIALNNKRRKISEEVNKKVLELGDIKVAQSNPPVIVVAGDFHEGVIGISAAKLVDKYNRPSIVIGLNPDGHGKASCRSIEGFNVKLAIDYSKDFHLGGGGHDMAAGFSIKKDQIEAFEKKVIEYFLTHPPIQEKEVLVESELLYDEINGQSIKLIEMFEPVGKNNEPPMVRINNCPVATILEIRGGHLMYILENEMTITVFNPSESLKNNKSIKKLDVIGELSSYKTNFKITAKKIIEK